MDNEKKPLKKLTLNREAIKKLKVNTRIKTGLAGNGTDICPETYQCETSTRSTAGTMTMNHNQTLKKRNPKTRIA